MRFIDFFAGIGGFRLGMEMAGHECVGHCEIDHFADKSYRAMHIPKESEWFAKDITTVKYGDLPKAECYCFGFPCQSFSVAGSRRGFADTRGTLFFEVMRIAKERKPEYLFAENVAGLLSHDGGRTFGTILATLGELGYWWEYQVLNSKNFGVPQNRERVFIIGHLGGRGGREIFPITGEGGGANQKFRNKINIIGSTKREHQTSLGQRDVVYGSNGIIGALTANDYKQPKQIAIPVSTSGRDEFEINQIGNLIDTKSFGGNPQGGRVYGIDGISPCLTAMGGGGLEPKIVIGSMQKNAYVGDGKKSPTLTKAMGTGGGHIPMVGFETKSLTAQDRHGVATGEQGDLRIRKLTPKECFRLQGFPDEYFERAARVNSDSQLYKQAGNGVTVNVIYEIAKRLKEV